MIWKSIFDEMPKPFTRVLVLHSESVIEISSLIDWRREKKGLGESPRQVDFFNWKDVGANEFHDKNVVRLDGIGLPNPPVVTHWMELPEIKIDSN